MADTAYEHIYRKEAIAAFQRQESGLRFACTGEAMAEGRQATFLVSDSGSDGAVTRGINGQIPAGSSDFTQKTVTLEEWHVVREITNFNLFTAQSDLRRQLQLNAATKMGQKIDDLVTTQLDTATNNMGAAATLSLGLVQDALAELGNNNVPLEDEDNIFLVITPKAQMYLRQIPEFASADYVDVKPLTGPMKRMRRWSGMNIICTSALTGNGTSSEKMYLFHRDAMGFAFNKDGIDVELGTDGRHGYDWVRNTFFMQALVLQDSGIMQILHDGS